MKAALVQEYKQPLQITDVDRPTIAEDEVLVEVEACGVCHSDLHLAEGDWPQLKRLIKMPFIPGHEVVGHVVEKGQAVTDLSIGDRVGVAWLHWSCGECELCREGLENLCPRQSITGASVDGGFAQFIKAKASHTLKVPDSLSSEEAAPLFCAGVTVYRAIKKAEIKPGQRVAVFGIGGLGHLAVQIAKAFGAKVIAVDVSDEKLEFARSLGAETTINAAATDAAKELRSMGGAHVVVVTIGSKAAYNSAFSSVRSAGTLVVVGFPSEEISFPAIMMREMKIISTATGTRQDVAEVLEMAASGKIRCQVEARQLDEVNEIFEDMRRGRITGRIVLTFK
ncbi:MAG TPA: zinc-dependent alcohol dehydrogenase [Blastocatellia bacterium]|jgi:propanol-preferring alcohol dehydrogenase